MLICYLLKTMVYTWYVDTNEMDGPTATESTADETPMISCVNVHAVLEGRRNHAKASPSDSDSSQEYFYCLENDLSPHSNAVNFSDLSICRVGGGPQAPRSALPIRAQPAVLLISTATCSI